MKKLKKRSRKSLHKACEGYINQNHAESLSNEDASLIGFTLSLKENIDIIKSLLSHSDDIIIRHFKIPTIPSIEGAIVFIKSIVDLKLVESNILAPLMLGLKDQSSEELGYFHANIKALLEENLSSHSIESYNDAKAAVLEALGGNGIIFVDGFPAGITVAIGKGSNKESAEPQTERVVKGPQQGFVEDSSVNLAMIRRRIKSTDLVIREFQLGKETKSNIVVAYLKTIAEPAIVDEVLNRLDDVGRNVDGITSTGGIEDYITDNPLSLFQADFSTERPDRASAMLLEGRIAIIYDGSPFVLMAPSIVADFFSTSEDYYLNFYFATFNRLIRYFGALVVMFLPAIYVAVTTYHQEMLPTRLALTLAGTRSGVPYPAYFEALFMEMAFEALREAGIRLPTHIGQAVSIVGALIIGQSAVEAGLVSPAVVIIVATTAIFSFTIPFSNFSLGLRLTRFINMTLAALLGIYGIIAGFLFIGLTLSSLRSFGVPFMAPFAPTNLQDMRDYFLRLPQWAIKKRSSHVANKQNLTKKQDHLKPQPPMEEGGDGH
ncbi:spore germination protein [Alkaliphilus serpentinus]|uniref:Spore germination protein n=1 Tax=Alkaliphilus serpentinus TaxID=1482731 RepID=A0A833MAI9_9FIRM|nr:spore germination protein [Alkaliphilus serpentinus]KAB3531089.1 spore germination protein [Alkaliphilus serpentinus]